VAGSGEVWVTEAGTETGAEAETEAVGQGLGSPGPVDQGWVSRQRMARMESSSASAGSTVA
jgi:hypothetical protein